MFNINASTFGILGMKDKTFVFFGIMFFALILFLSYMAEEDFDEYEMKEYKTIQEFKK